MIHDRYERSVCDCYVCRSACETMPGSLHPDDLDRMAANLGVEVASMEFASWLADNFVASDGGIFLVDGKVRRLASIVPRQEENGHCVFLKDGKCSIHHVAPFSCSHFSCQDDPLADEKSILAATEIAQSEIYSKIWDILYAAGLVVTKSIAQRRADWHKKIAAGKSGGPHREAGTCDGSG